MTEGLQTTIWLPKNLKFLNPEDQRVAWKLWYLLSSDKTMPRIERSAIAVEVKRTRKDPLSMRDLGYLKFIFRTQQSSGRGGSKTKPEIYSFLVGHQYPVKENIFKKELP